MWRFFKAPFPRQAGFGAYAYPGRIVHVPFLLMVVALGWGLCGWDPQMRWVIAVYALAGVYLGRELAMWAHYNLLITIAVVGGFIASIVFIPDIVAWLEFHVHEPQRRWPGFGVAGVLLGITIALAIDSIRTLAAIEPPQDDTKPSEDRQNADGLKPDDTDISA